jgi:secreted trypsin-like serine protease
MSDRRIQISEAALRALEYGNNDDRMILNGFRAHAPAQVRIPANPTAKDLRSLRVLIERASRGAATISNGEETLDFPSVVALGQTDDEATFGCSGILISPDIVLTAGHCIDDGFTGGVWLKDANGRRLLPLPGGHTKHAAFGDPSEFSNDIGMLRLSEPVANVDIHSIADGATIDQATLAVIAGFGQDGSHSSSIDIRRAADVIIRLNPSDGTIGFEDLEFVIGSPTIVDDGDACDGDSGGAAFVVVGGGHQLAGLISRGVNPPVCGDGTICLRLDRYTQWIDDNIQTLGGQPRPV